jgi:hypothetical protein
MAISTVLALAHWHRRSRGHWSSFSWWRQLQRRRRQEQTAAGPPAQTAAGLSAQIAVCPPAEAAAVMVHLVGVQEEW